MTITQLANAQHDPGRPEDVLKVDIGEDGEGGDDAYDCFRFGVMAVPAPVKVVRQQARHSYLHGGSIG